LPYHAAATLIFFPHYKKLLASVTSTATCCSLVTCKTKSTYSRWRIRVRRRGRMTTQIKVIFHLHSCQW
jgi:hypothetical protein